MEVYPVENNSTEKLTCPQKEGIHLFLGRTQKILERSFLCCCQDTVDCFGLLPSKPDYLGLDSPETQSKDTTPGSEVKCFSEQRTENLGVQDHSNISGAIQPMGGLDNPSLHKMSTNITTVNITPIAEDSVKKSSTKNLWKKTQSFLRRARKTMTRPLLCSGINIVEPSVLLIESTEALCGGSTQITVSEELSDGTSDGSSDLKSIPEAMLPGEADSGMEDSFVETDSEQPTGWMKKDVILFHLKRTWRGLKKHLLWCWSRVKPFVPLPADSEAPPVPDHADAVLNNDESANGADANVEATTHNPPFFHSFSGLGIPQKC